MEQLADFELKIPRLEVTKPIFKIERPERPKPIQPVLPKIEM